MNLSQAAFHTLPVVCVLAFCLTGCTSTTAPAANVTLSVDDEGFPVFAGGGEADADEVDRLNDVIAELAEEYRDTLDDDERSWTVSSILQNGERILQGTIYIRKEESTLLNGSTTTRQLASFAFDTQEHIGYTAQDALEADPLTGVELSTRVQQAFSVLEPDADLLSTEMQGFLLNDDATTQFLYMRIEEEPDPENPADQPTEVFYLYDPAVDAMAALEWPAQ